MSNKIDFNELRVPRYTSYPTAPHFNADTTVDIYKEWLSELSDNVSLYVHIPFCEELCSFCGCYTKITKRYDPITKYLDLLFQEIKLVSDIKRNRPVTHIHFGGGSPTILRPEDFVKIIDTFRDGFDISRDTEIAVEMDPRTFSEEKVKAYAKSGVNRASIGVQDFNEKVQKAVNRIQPFSLVSNVIGYLRSNGIDKINMDLIYGLPFQTVDTVSHTVEQALTLDPDRISLFGYAHVPWMKKHQQLIDESTLPTSDDRMSMFERATELFEAAGYVAIGLDHFAKKDDDMVAALKNRTLKRNFQGYTTDTADALIGFGVSSISSLPNGYIQNVSLVQEYERALTAGNLPIIRGRKITEEDIFRRAIIESLMCYFSVDLDEMTRKYNMPDSSFEKEFYSLQSFVDNGYVRINGKIINVTTKGKPLVRVVCAAFDQYLDSGAAKHSHAV